MKTEIVRYAGLTAAILCAAALQDVMPPFLGVEPPILLVLSCAAGVPGAVLAGVFADALSGVPFGCHALFFAAAAAGVRITGIRLPVTLAAAALLPFWLALWGASAVSFAAPFAESALALPLALIAGPAVRRFARLAGLPPRKEEAR